MKVRILYQDDGSVHIIHPAIKSKREDESEEDWLNRVFTKAMVEGGFSNLEYDDIDESELPSREFRDAWIGSKGNGISIDPIKKQQIIDAQT